MAPKTNIQHLIMRALSSAHTLPQEDLESMVAESLIDIESNDRKVPSKYVIRRTVKRLIDSGVIELRNQGDVSVVSLSTNGSNKLRRASLSNKHGVFPTVWDGRWRIVILDFDSDEKRVRDAVRYILKKANFYCIKPSVWVTPFDYIGFIDDMKYHMKLTDETMTIIAEQMDAAIERELMEYFGVSR